MPTAVLSALVVGLGGFFGALARFLLSWWVGAWTSSSFPWPTFVVNIAGCFALGVLAEVASTRVAPQVDYLRLALGVGFLGAFTTFSTFEFEAVALLKGGAPWMSVAYVAASVVVGFLALRAGGALADAWW